MRAQAGAVTSSTLKVNVYGKPVWEPLFRMEREKLHSMNSVLQTLFAFFIKDPWSVV